jgi:hypothetical protein
METLSQCRSGVKKMLAFGLAFRFDVNQAGADVPPPQRHFALQQCRDWSLSRANFP